ncbi:Dual specificity protein phosphatase 10 [Triplophysa tibetana]|uniref:protein-tyrosine-phosphatase n=1 Tax=Triplophysa tibetana TaxID=1572043 RepID=A0A5A9PEE4_9TELE|nr:Dual specificity protein phosphatase 10 [Triplophysa tibetana]
MPPLPLDERIVVIQRPKSLALRVASPPTTSQSSSHRPAAYNEAPPRSPQPPPPRCHPGANFLSLECKGRQLSHVQRDRGDRGAPFEGSSHNASHCHTNGTVTLGPRLQKHTHTIDIKLSLDKGARGGSYSDKGRSSSLTRSGNSKSNQTKKVSLHLDPVQGDRKCKGKSFEFVEKYQTHHQNQNRIQHSRHHQNQLTVSPGGILEFVPAQRQQTKPNPSRRRDLSLKSACYPSHTDKDVSSVGNKENSKLGPGHQHPHTQSLSRHHSSALLPHAAILNPHYPAIPPSLPSRAPSSYQHISQPRPSRLRDHRPQILHTLPLSPTSSRGGFPSPDHTCTIDFSHPCGCWRLVRCRRGRGHSASCHGRSTSPSSSFSHVQGTSAANGSDGTMGLKTLGGCLSTASTTNTSSSNSTVSDCRPGRLRPLGCASCSGEAGGFESPAAFRKKLVGGCIPCTPLSSSAPLRALQSCVSGCNPKASQTGSSTCSYCSSDPIVVTYNPHRGNPPTMGRNIGAKTMGYQADDDDYSVRTIWPEELAKKMTRSKTQPNPHNAGSGMGSVRACMGHNQNSGSSNNPVILDCRNLKEFTRTHLTDQAGRRRLQQGKMAVLDFIGSGSSGDQGRDSLKRLWNKGGDTCMGDGNGFNDEVLPQSPSLRSPSPDSPPSFSPPPSAPSTLIKPKPKQREREGGHTLPSAQSLHLVLNSLNREQDEENGRVNLSLPLSSSLPASLSEESVMTPDVENAVISPILPFLFLGNERDAQDLDLLLRLNIGFVVNVTTHLPLYHLDTGLVRYKRLPATDNSKQNLQQYFEEVFEFIEEAHQCGRGVLVHCQAGVSRSATIVIAYLMKHTLMTMTDAYKYVRGRRPVVSPNLNFMGQLLEFERDLNSGVTPRILTPKLSGLETQV